MQLQLFRLQSIVPSQIILPTAQQLKALFLPELFHASSFLQTTSPVTCTCVLHTMTSYVFLFIYQRQMQHYYSIRSHYIVCRRQITVHIAALQQGSSRMEPSFSFPIFSPATPFVCVMSSTFIWSFVPLTRGHSRMNTVNWLQLTYDSTCNNLLWIKYMCVHASGHFVSLERKLAAKPAIQFDHIV